MVAEKVLIGPSRQSQTYHCCQLVAPHFGIRTRPEIFHLMLRIERKLLENAECSVTCQIPCRYLDRMENFIPGAICATVVHSGISGQHRVVLTLAFQLPR